MQTHQVKRKTANRDRAYVGRGGKRGKTAGRGTKGQKSRAGRKFRPALRDIIKKLPKNRGYKFKSIQPKPYLVDMAALEKAFKTGGAVNPKTLLEKGLIETQKGRIPKVKILGSAEVTKAFNISGCLVSAAIKAKIEKAGGKVE